MVWSSMYTGGVILTPQFLLCIVTRLGTFWEPFFLSYSVTFANGTCAYRTKKILEQGIIELSNAALDLTIELHSYFFFFNFFFADCHSAPCPLNNTCGETVESYECVNYPENIGTTSAAATSGIVQRAVITRAQATSIRFFFFSDVAARRSAIIRTHHKSLYVFFKPQSHRSKDRSSTFLQPLETCVRQLSWLSEVAKSFLTSAKS